MLLKIWLYRSDAVIGQENLVWIKNQIGMNYSIKPELYELLDMLLVCSLMFLMIYGILNNPSLFDQYFTNLYSTQLHVEKYKIIKK